MLQRLRDARTRGHDASPRGAPPSAPMSARLSTADWTGLQAAIAGDVVRPGRAALRARAPARHRALRDVRPQAIVRCRDTGRRRRDARVRSPLTAMPRRDRSGGHCFAGRSSTDGIADRRRADELGLGRRRRARRSARARGSATSTTRSTTHGRTIAGGCGPTVGIAGLTLGGGLGILGRRHGLTCDQLVAAEVVLADGRVVDCDAEHDADLFWALRGAGGGRFGVVTSLDASHGSRAARDELPPALAARARRRGDRRVAGLGARRARRARGQPAGHRPRGPDRMVAVSAVRRRCSVPEPTRGAGSTRSPSAPAREPAAAALTELPYREDQAPPRRARRRIRAEPEPAHLLSQVRVLPALPAGGRDRRPRRASGHRPASRDAPASWTSRPGAAPTTGCLRRHRVRAPRRAVPAQARGHRRGSARRCRGRASGWRARGRWCTRAGTGGAYPNFPDPELSPWDPAYHGANGDRLRRITASYDPDGVFGANDRR